MEYFFEVYSPLQKQPLSTFCRWENLESEVAKFNFPPVEIRITNNTTGIVIWLRTSEDIEEFLEARRTNSLWSKNVTDAVKAKHHKGFIEELQWLDALSRIPRFRENHEAFKGAVELQVRKYLDRNGRKDKELQELLKGLWYMLYYVLYVQNDCKPILGSQVDEIIEKVLNAKVQESSV